MVTCLSNSNNQVHSCHCLPQSRWPWSGPTRQTLLFCSANQQGPLNRQGTFGQNPAETDLAGQQDEVQDQQQEPLKESLLESRVAVLEARLERLERILFATSVLSVFEAERNLAEAEARLLESERLFLRGFLTDAQVAQDRFNFDRAKQELRLVKNMSDGRRITAEIDLMAARNTFRQAKEQLQTSESLARRGFSSETQINSNRQQVEVARQELEIARKRLQALIEADTPADDHEASNKKTTDENATDDGGAENNNRDATNDQAAVDK